MTRKTTFFERLSWFKFSNLGLALGIALKFYTSVAKESKLKVRKFWCLIRTFVEVIGEKLVESEVGRVCPLHLPRIGLILFLVFTIIFRFLRNLLITLISDEGYMSCSMQIKNNSRHEYTAYSLASYYLSLTDQECNE